MSAWDFPARRECAAASKGSTRGKRTAERNRSVGLLEQLPCIIAVHLRLVCDRGPCPTSADPCLVRSHTADPARTLTGPDSPAGCLSPVTAVTLPLFRALFPKIPAEVRSQSLSCRDLTCGRPDCPARVCRGCATPSGPSADGRRREAGGCGRFVKPGNGLSPIFPWPGLHVGLGHSTEQC